MKKNFKYLFISLLAITQSLIAYSQTHKIDIEISDLSNQEIFLGYYYGDKTFVSDTITLDSKGKGTFQGDSLLDQGVYLVVMPSKSYFELLVGSDQTFKAKTTSTGLLKDLKIEGSKEAEGFLEFQTNMMNQNKEMMALQEKLKSLPEGSAESEDIKNKMDNVSNGVKAFWDETIENNKDNLIGVLVKAMKNPEIPEIEVPADVQNKDSVRWFHSYNYNRTHYFDNIDFTDARLIRTPVFHNKLNVFFTKIIVQAPDTINKYIDIVANEAEESPEMFQYVVRYFYNTFVNSNIMGMDKVFVHVAENYYLTDKVDWLEEETLQKMRDEVAKHKFNLVGSIAQDLKMETLTMEYARLKDIHSKYTLVMFWEPHCGHCKKVVPAVHKFYQDFTRDEFEVMAVYTQTDKEEWAKYIEEKGFDDWINVWDPYNLTNFRFFYNVYSTPTLYLLDENKKIIAKRISHETVKNILELELGKKNVSKVLEEKKERGE